MPIFKNVEQSFFKIIVWEITEDEATLTEGITLHPSDSKKLNTLKNASKRREFLALRQCLKVLFKKNPPVHYTLNGKPYLENDYYISFSHTKNFAAVICSQTHSVGVDLEGFRKGVLKIKPKFIRDEEAKTLQNHIGVEHLTAYWGAKEVIVKIEGDRKLDFKKDIRVSPFLFKGKQCTRAILIKEGELKNYRLFFQQQTNFLLTYGWLIAD